MPSDTEKATVLPAENAGMRKNRSGIIGMRCVQLPPQQGADQDEASDERR